MKETLKTFQFQISDESYELLCEYSDDLNIRKSMYLDYLIKNYASSLKDDIYKKLNRYNEQR